MKHILLFLTLFLFGVCFLEAQSLKPWSYKPKTASSTSLADSTKAGASAATAGSSSTTSAGSATLNANAMRSKASDAGSNTASIYSVQTTNTNCSGSSSRKAENLYSEAKGLYQRGQTYEAIEKLQSAVLQCDSYAAAYMLLGVIYEDAYRVDSAIMCYETALKCDPNIFTNAYYTLANLQYSRGLYESAKKNLKEFFSRQNTASSSLALIEKAKNLQNRVEYAADLYSKAVPFMPINMGDSINSDGDEYFPLVSMDDESLVFTRRYYRTVETETKPTRYSKSNQEVLPKTLEEDFFISTKDSNGNWKKAIRMPDGINTELNEGSISISADGKYLYFSGCGREDSRGGCDIYVCVKNGENWGKPINLGLPINTSAWESQPSISSDGTTLYFASNREGGFGGSDIWMSRRSSTGIWSEPVNLGENINTTGNENSPFIHHDQTTLYFSSDMHPGLGGQDLFFSKKDADGNWSKPENLGFPINTYASEATLSLNRTGDTAYYSSSKLGGKGGMDIYKFELYEKARPSAVSFMKGRVLDKKHGHELGGAKFELIDLSSSKTTIETFSDPITGEYLLCLPYGRTYSLNVYNKGYTFHSEHIGLDELNSNYAEPQNKDIELMPVEKGSSIVLRNIFFEVSSYKLTAESEVELNALYRFLLENKDIRIEISGHTDASGSYDYNIELSRQRAESVAKYLITRNIDKSRLEVVGYGSSKPISTNDTEEGKALNRRTEVKIL